MSSLQAFLELWASGFVAQSQAVPTRPTPDATAQALNGLRTQVDTLTKQQAAQMAVNAALSRENASLLARVDTLRQVIEQLTVAMRASIRDVDDSRRIRV